MKRLLYPSLSLVCLLGSMCLISGCSTSMSMPDTQGTGDFGITKGGVFGGQNPVTGAQVYIFETQPSAGYGTTAPKSLLGVGVSGDTCGVTTGRNKLKFPLVQNGSNCYYQTGGYNGGGTKNSAVGDGEFNLSGLYSCDVGQQVWLFAIDGYTTFAPAGRNQYASELADLGACPASGNFSADNYIFMNELSTVAMAYAVAGFTADTAGSSHGLSITISGPSSNPAGLANAFNNAQQLYNIFGLTDQPDLSAPQTTTTGARNGIPPYKLINTLGNALAACINSTGESYPTPANGSPCYEFFLDVYGTTTVVTDTASGMIHIAKNPLLPNPSNLIALGATDPVWNPYYGSAPYDLTAAISWGGGGPYPYGMILDPSGNAYVDDYTSNGFMTQYTPLGAVTNTSTVPTPIANAAALAVDSTGLIWTTSLSAGTIYDVSSTSSFGTVSTGSGTLAASTLTYPDLIAADTSGNVYIANPYQGTGVVYRTNASGSSNLTITPAIAGNGCVTNATGVAVNHDGTLWVTGYGVPDIVCRVSNSGSTFYTGAPNASGFGAPPGAISRADAVAAGSPTCNGTSNTGGSGCAWVIDHNDAKLYNVANNGTTTATVTTAGSGGGIALPVDVAVDGNGDAWVLDNNMGTGALSEFSPAGVALSGTNGFQYSSLSAPSALGIDISGNVWVSDTGHGDVVEVIGLAIPTAALSAGNPGTKP